MKQTNKNCILLVFAVLSLLLFTSTATAQEPKWVKLYADYIDELAKHQPAPSPTPTPSATPEASPTPEASGSVRAVETLEPAISPGPSAPPEPAVIFSESLTPTPSLAPTPSPTPTPAPSPTPSPTEIYGPVRQTPAPLEATPRPPTDPTPTPSPTPPLITGRIRCFMMFADLDLDSVPELVYGYNDQTSSEIRIGVWCIVDGKVVQASGNEIQAAYDLKSSALTLYRTQKGYVWMMTNGGLEGTGGRRQVRHTMITYKDGVVRGSNRFTKRWTSTQEQFFVDGNRVEPVAYKEKYAEYKRSVKAIGRVPHVLFGDVDKTPTSEQMRQAIRTLTERYLAFSKPEKMKLSGENATFKFGEKQKAKLLIAPAYASVTRQMPTWSSSDLGVCIVGSKGTVKAVGYGSTIISATLPDGSSAHAKITVTRPKVTKLAIKAETQKLRIGEQMQLFYALSPAPARADVIWKSNNPSVVQVDEKTGLVTAIRKGKARIGCWVNRKIKAGIDLTVYSGHWVTGIALSDETKNLEVGDRFALTATMTPENAINKTLTWSSTDPKVATVSSTGWVTALAPGTTTIAASALGGAYATMTVDVSYKGYQKYTEVPDGIYKLAYKTSGAMALGVKGFTALQRQSLVSEPDNDSANQRFAIQNIGAGIVEIRPLSAPKMFLCVSPDPVNPENKSRVALMLNPKESERRFKVTRLANDMVVFSLASDPNASFGISQETEGAPVVAMSYSENALNVRFQLTLLSEPTKLEPTPSPVPGAPAPTPTPLPAGRATAMPVDPPSFGVATAAPGEPPTLAQLTAEAAAQQAARTLPTPIPTAAPTLIPTAPPTPTPKGAGNNSPSSTPAPRQLDWIKNIEVFLTEHQTEIPTWTHIQLCDLDWSGIPELIIYTGQRSKPISLSLTAQEALIYSPETGKSILGRFPYEPDANKELKDPYPLVRLLIDGATKDRRWVLTDGVDEADEGALRYVLMHYKQGAVTCSPLFGKSWRPPGDDTEGLAYETFSYEGKEVSQYSYNLSYQQYFKGSIWGNSVKAVIECEKKSLPEVLARVKMMIASRRWYS